MKPSNYDAAFSRARSGGVSVVAAAVGASGGSWKRPAVAASLANVVLASGLIDGASVGGVTLAAGDRVLLWGQTDATQNGIYVSPGAGTASRAADANSGAAMLGAVVLVMEGDYADRVYVCTTDGPIILGTTDLAWSELRAYPRLHSELLVADGITFPPDPLYNEDGTDFLYGLFES